MKPTLPTLPSVPELPEVGSAAAVPAAEHWDLVIRPKTGWFDLNLSDLWRYRDLLWMFVWRDFVSVYKQTILGPVWFILQPLLTTVVFTVIFSGVGKVPTDGLPPMLFYLAGTTPWNYFATCVTKTSGVFVNNAGIFGKVYFPRLVTPVSIVASTLVQFGIQFLLFLGILAYFLVRDASLHPQAHLIHPNLPMILLLTPVLLILMALLGLGAGILASSLTTKYRDLNFLIAFGVQLAMYGSCVIFSLASVPPKYLPFIEANPMTAIIVSFRAIYLGGDIPWHQLGLSALVTAVILLVGVCIFNKVEKGFMDTV